MNKILFIDTLTTGINTERCAIYRIGGIFCEESANTMKEVRRFDLAVRPFEGARIIENSLWVGGVTRGLLAGYPAQDKAFADFFALIDERINVKNVKDKLYICGFNVSSFDAPFLKNWFTRNGNGRYRDCFFVQTIDLMSIAAFAMMNFREDMPDFHLETAAKVLGVSPTKGEHYCCLDNAETCVKMYIELKRRLSSGAPEGWSPLERVFSNLPIKI